VKEKVSRCVVRVSEASDCEYLALAKCGWPRPFVLARRSLADTAVLHYELDEERRDVRILTSLLSVPTTISGLQ
jgi:hypothetical protein